MSKKVQKTLTATLVATLATGSMGMPAFAKQNNKDLDATYKAAYEATVKTQDLNKVTQGDINIARRAINELRGTCVESAIPTFSSIVDKAQQKFLEIAYNSILKCQKTGLQRDINIARTNIENLPEQFKNPYSMAIDIVQQKLIDRIYEAVQKAEETLKGEDLNKVQSLLNDLKTAVYNEGVKTWAIKYEETNINPLKVKCGYKVQLNNTKLDIYKDNKDGIPNTTKITVYKLDEQRNELGVANNANIEVLNAKGNNAEKEKEISIKENTIEGLKDGTYIVKVKIGDYLVKQITITVVNTAPRPSTITFKSKTATVYSGITLENLLSDLEYSVKDQFGGLLNNKLVGIKYKVENKNAATINPISKDGQSLEDQIRYTLFDNEGRLLNQGNFDLAIESITVKDSKMANGEKVINFSTPMVIKVIVNSGSGDSSESTKPIVKPDKPHTKPEVKPEKPEINKELLKQIEEKRKAALKALKDAEAKTEGVTKDNVTTKMGEEAVSSAEKTKAVVREYTDLVNANKKDLDAKTIDDAEQKTQEANEQLKKADDLMEDARTNLIKEVTVKRDAVLKALKDAQEKTLDVHEDNVTIKTAQEAVTAAEKVVTMVKDFTELVNGNVKYVGESIANDARQISKEANEQLKKADSLMEKANNDLIKVVTAKRDNALKALEEAQAKTQNIKDNVTIKTAEEAVNSAKNAVAIVKDYTDLVNANKKYLNADIVSEAEKTTQNANDQLKKANELMEQATSKLNRIDKAVLTDQANVEKQKGVVKTLKVNNDKLQNTLNNEIAKYNKIQADIKTTNAYGKTLNAKYSNLEQKIKEFDKVHDKEESLLNKQSVLKEKLKTAIKNNQKVKEQTLRIELQKVTLELHQVQATIFINKVKEAKANKDLEEVEGKIEGLKNKLTSLNKASKTAEQNVQNAKKELDKSETNLKTEQNLLGKYEDKLVADLGNLINVKGQFKSNDSILTLGILQQNKANLSVKTGKNGINKIVVNTTVYTLQ